MGNRTQEQVLDPSSALAQTRSRVFNSLSRLYRELGALSQTTEYAYDESRVKSSQKLKHAAIKYWVFGRANVVYFWNHKTGKLANLTTVD